MDPIALVTFFVQYLPTDPGGNRALAPHICAISGLPESRETVLQLVDWFLLYHPISTVRIMYTPASARGWHRRATRTSSAGFEPRVADLVVLALISTMADPEGFTMASCGQISQSTGWAAW